MSKMLVLTDKEKTLLNLLPYKQLIGADAYTNMLKRIYEINDNVINFLPLKMSTFIPDNANITNRHFKYFIKLVENNPFCIYDYIDQFSDIYEKIDQLLTVPIYIYHFLNMLGGVQTKGTYIHKDFRKFIVKATGSPQFIVLEGGDGIGKDTLLAYISNKYGNKNIVFTREPGGTVVGEKIRKILLDEKINITPDIEILLFASSRSAYIENIQKLLAEGKTVISSRYFYSSIYQKLAYPHKEKFIDILNDEVVTEYPDYVISCYIDNEKELINRIRNIDKKYDRIELRPDNYFISINNYYKNLFSKCKHTENYIPLEMSGTISENNEKMDLIMSRILL